MKTALKNLLGFGVLTAAVCWNLSSQASIDLSYSVSTTVNGSTTLSAGGDTLTFNPVTGGTLSFEGTGSTVVEPWTTFRWSASTLKSQNYPVTLQSTITINGVNYLVNIPTTLSAGSYTHGFSVEDTTYTLLLPDNTTELIIDIYGNSYTPTDDLTVEAGFTLQAVPEPSTIVAGLLLLLPLVYSTKGLLRQRQ